MSKPGGAISQGPHVGAANRVMCDKVARRYFRNWLAGDTRTVERTHYTFTTASGTRIHSSSKYMPHQNVREMNRRAMQEARRVEKYMMNGGFTRTGNEAGLIGGKGLI